MLFPAPLICYAGAAGSWADLILLYSARLGDPRLSDCRCRLWWVPAAQSLLHQRLLGLASKFLESDCCEFTGKRASLRELLDALGAAHYVRSDAAAAPEWLTAASAPLPASGGHASLDSEAVHPGLRRIYRAEGIFDRPVGELPAQSPNACSRVRR